MPKASPNAHRVRHGSVTQQVAAHLRGLVRSGVVGPAGRLPSHRDLAHQLGIPRSTVNLAVQTLEQDGLLVRHHGSGTFLRERPKTLRTLGLYYFGESLAHPERRFLRAVHECLRRRIGESGRRWAMWNDPRPDAEGTEPWTELADACRRGDVDALIIPACDPQHHAWLSKLPMATAFAAGDDSIPHRVDIDSCDIGRLGVEELARQGCRTVGLIAPTSVERKSDDRDPHVYAIQRGFMEGVDATGLRTARSWMVTEDDIRPMAYANAQWGYQAFKRLWKRPTHPDGLVVANDAEGLGVTMSIIKEGLRVPEDLRVVYHKNAEVDVFCPFSVAHVVVRADDVARTLIEMVERESRGEKVVPMVVRFTLEPAGRGDSTVEEREEKQGTRKGKT